MSDQPIIRQYISPGGLGWVLALIALLLCIIFYFVPAAGASPVTLFLVGLVAASRLC